MKQEGTARQAKLLLAPAVIRTVPSSRRVALWLNRAMFMAPGVTVKIPAIGVGLGVSVGVGVGVGVDIGVGVGVDVGTGDGDGIGDRPAVCVTEPQPAVPRSIPVMRTAAKPALTRMNSSTLSTTSNRFLFIFDRSLLMS